MHSDLIVMTFDAEAALAGVLSALYDLGYSLQLVRKVKRKGVAQCRKRMTTPKR